MQSQNRFFEDIAKLANGAAGTFAGVAREVEGMVKEGVQRAMGGMDFVSRDEFEAVKEMAATARAEAADLRARLDAMTGAAPAAKASTKPRAKKSPPPTA